VVLGGRYVTKVVGAVPVIVVLGDVVAVPPVIASVDPAPEPPGSDQTVVSVITVGVVLLLTLACKRMNWLV
jgi:hypothetical protein